MRLKLLTRNCLKRLLLISLKCFHDAIIQKSDQWDADKAVLESEKEELIKTAEESSKLIEDLKSEVATVSEDLQRIKTNVSAREESDRFKRKDERD